MKKLRGSLCIKMMENAVTKDEANEAQLGDIIGIHKLEVQWSSPKGGKDGTEFNLIRLPSNIYELKITWYGAKSFPDWLSGDRHRAISVIHLFDCNCTYLPEPGKLINLESLYIQEMHSVIKEINHELICWHFSEFKGTKNRWNASLGEMDSDQHAQSW
ncbi:hypothetical protein NE237_023057 [Protea cynaroides]|uniref:R13L1/DRL21-like LRR repeat region domain-containing protein n=1 Tax=Protea cynaroides TaxID=273540 RepID=A0A9Q0HBI7_9MAGN|nr:hypothetical protein NE237_023057 [Protea cynaroides]